MFISSKAARKRQGRCARERKKKQNEARSNKTKTKTILVSALLDSGPSGYEGDLKKYKRWGGGGGGEDGALANPAICRTLFYGKRELVVAGQKQEILSGQD